MQDAKLNIALRCIKKIGAAHMDRTDAEIITINI